MTKWIKLQSSVGSRAAEKMRQDGGGEEEQEMATETKLKDSQRDEQALLEVWKHFLFFFADCFLFSQIMLFHMTKGPSIP